MNVLKRNTTWHFFSRNKKESYSQSKKKLFHFTISRLLIFLTTFIISVLIISGLLLSRISFFSIEIGLYKTNYWISRKQSIR